jgi:hypothetical protein
VVVGNPPYQAVKENGERKDNAVNLWSVFWKNSLTEWSAPDGAIALITPTTWMSPSVDVKKGKFRIWDEFEKHDTYADVSERIKKHFPSEGSSFGYAVVDKSGSGGLKFSDGRSTELGFLPKTLTGKNEAKPEISTDELLTYISLDPSETLGGNFRLNQDNRPERRVAIPITRSVSEDNVVILDGEAIPTTGSVDPRNYYYVYAGDDCETVKDAVINAKDVLNKYCRWVGYLNFKVTDMVRY